MSSLERFRQERLRKTERIRAMGINPYPYRYVRTHKAQEVLDDFEKLSEEGSEVSLAGRIVATRRHGKASFADIMDASGRIQIYVRQDAVGDDKYELYNLLEIGDFIGVRGDVFRTKTEEITIGVKDFQVLAKGLRPLPAKWHGLKDVELRYRQRYVDLIMNPEVREVFLTRTKIVQIVREVFDAVGGIEVETPTLQPLYGGASARPFETYHNALGMKMYLRIADELYLKRLIVGGFECVYEICNDFRNEGMDRAHNPEFTMVEIYWAYRDYNDMMDLTERLFVTVAERVKGSMFIEYNGQEIDLTPPWPRRPMLDLIKEHAGIEVAALEDEGLRTGLQRVYSEVLGEESEEHRKGVAELPYLNRGNMIDELFGLTVESHLIQPTFVMDYPKEISPLAKVHRDDHTLTERFELYINGWEMANAFSELNDPVDQRERFEAQMRLIEAGDEEAQPLDEDFLRALEYGMPPTGGLGIGIDRMTMLFTDQPSIQDVILFPQMRPET
jgi:lysyl-tRNA synthetase class 2